MDVFISFTPQQLIRAMREAVQTGFSSSPALKEAERQGMVKFVAWPSGHWQITPRGSDFIWENAT